MSVQPPNPPLQNPISGTTIDTSPQTLGLDDAQSNSSNTQPLNRRSNASKSVIKRTVESAAVKLGGSVLGGGLKRDNSSPRLSASFTSTPKRFLSLNRKGKAKDTSLMTFNDGRGESGNTSPASHQSPLPSRPTSPVTSNLASANEDSPFIRPSSPSLTSPSERTERPERPSLEALKTVGSLRVGTQTLIQAIQALPWTDEPDGDDEAIPPTSVNSDSSEDERNGLPLASSIHTIHRPIARMKRQDTNSSLRANNGKGKAVVTLSPTPSSDEDDGDVSSDEDFETTPIDPQQPPFPLGEEKEEGLSKTTPPTSPTESMVARLALTRRLMSRSASLATVKIKRRAKLASKLKDVFGLPEINEVVAELPCWLLRSILLQGYMYLTNSHICFFAHMPSREDQVLKSGSLNKKTQRTRRWIKHWFVLKNDALSWYQSSSDPYFPHGVIDLRYAISCEPFQDKGFKIRTNQTTVSLLADSLPSREEWVKAIRKVIFKAQNLGDSVKIAIPYSVIMDVDKSSAMDFSETIEVKVTETDEQDPSDSYFFAYFHNISLALDQIRDAVKTYKPFVQNSSHVTEAVRDTTGLKATPSTHAHLDRTVSAPVPEQSKSGYSLRFASLLRPFSSDSNSSTSTQAAISSRSGDNVQQLTRVASPSSIGTISTSISLTSARTIQPSVLIKATTDPLPIVASPTTMSDFSHTYPPPPSPSAELASLGVKESTSSGSSWGVPAWLRGSTKRVFTLPSASSSGNTFGRKTVSEVVSGSRSGDQASNDFAFSDLEARDAAEPEILEKFRSTFAFDEKEQLLGYFQGYLFRLLPTYGRLFISSNFFCFKSSGPLATKTRMMLPVRDILALETSKAYRFGHYGLVIIIKGHEELFFEFSTADRRDAFVTLLEQQMEEARHRLASGEIRTPNEEKKDALLLEELESPSVFGEAEPKPPPESMTDSLPAVMFTSTSSTFLTFKPQQPLRFTCLTIGTRGDVQPYIALAKGLMADGHKVRIATHGEFKEWIESYGIEFGYVGGDPAELMRICVENGMFTVSFLREGIQKFRGWLDDLLKTSWEACKDADVLIESPSAMGGIHIAEALKIPYYRAFTMTWTRTRAYPHAFAVPDHKMGGGYNYMSYVMFDQVFWRATAGQINRWRKNTLKLSSTGLDKLEQHKVPFLYNFSPSVVPPPLDWPEWIRVTGYWFLDDADVGAKKWAPPKELEDFIDNAHKEGKKVVYVGFGSIVVSDPDAMTRCVVDAIKRSGVYAILSKGWSDRLQAKKNVEQTEAEVSLPPQIYPVKAIPHDWLFKRIEAACHHGGAGTTGASLRAGIPTIIKPFFGDQFFWGDRIEALGVGSCVRKLTVDTLAEALTLVTTDEKTIDRARLLGDSIRSENGVTTAIESIYRDLEYARSLIKSSRPTAISDSDEDSGTRQSGPSRITFGNQISPDQTGVSTADSWHDDSGQGAPSEDWSVISDSEERRSSRDLRESPTSKRSSLAAAVLSVLPDVLSSSSPKNRAS